MKLKFTLLRGNGEPVKVAVTVDGTAKVGDVARAIQLADPARGGAAVPEGLSLIVADPLTGRGSAGRSLDPAANLLESGIRSGASVTVVREDGRFARAGAARGPAVKVQVVGGPDEGRVYSVPFGTSVIGRDVTADVRLTDPLVSKRHARLTVGDRIEITDTNSANGIVISGSTVQRAELRTGDEFLLGDSRLTVVQLHRANGNPTTSPVIDFNRSPRVEPRFDSPELIAPEPPKQAPPRKFPLVASVAPLIMGSVMFLVTKSILSIVFVALSPLVVLGNYFDNKLTSRREFRAATQKFSDGLAVLRAEATAVQVRERAVRTACFPSVAQTVEAIQRLGPLLWTRRPEHDRFLCFRLGIGTTPSQLSITTSGRNNTEPQYWTQLQEAVSEFAFIDNVPVSVDFRVSGAVGISGPGEQTDAVARGIAMQMFGLHSPAELAVVALVSPRSRAVWEWLEWLPHNGSAHSPIPGDHLADGPGGSAVLLAKLEDLITKRQRGSTARPTARGRLAEDSEVSEPEEMPVPVVMVIVEDDCLADRGRLIRVAENGPDVGIYVLWRSATTGQLPSVCRTYVEIDGGDGRGNSVGQVRFGRTASAVVSEGLSAEVAEQLALMMAPVVDISVPTEDATDLPRSAGILTLEGGGRSIDPDAIFERWIENGSLVSRWGMPGQGGRKRKPADLRALVGHDGTSEFYLDIRNQGPHALVGGTTGAGKSEFLQAWILGLASAHSPERVTFLFIDYKGGSAFAQCLDLPHTVGQVTDLSPHMVRRALTSLKAELRHREELFNRLGAKDLAQMEQDGHRETPPSLLIVIDEFAALVKEVPEFVDGVVDVAQRGRSLGLHLILATQRPAGVINDNLRANTNLRIALRMADISDSADVLGDPMAGYFDPSIPGRAAAKTGPGRIATFQTAFAGGVTTNKPKPPEINIAELSFGTRGIWEIPKTDVVEEEAGGEKDIERIVKAVVVAARRAGAASPRLPWLDVLLPCYDLADPTLGQVTDSKLLLGMLDDPKKQDQRPTFFEPDVDGNIAVYGAGGSGKSTVLRTLAVAAAYTPEGGPVQVYGLDFSSGGLAPLEPLSYVGSIISGDDSERIARLIKRLREIVDSRNQRYAAHNAVTITSYRSSSGDQNEPRILVLIDGFGTLKQEYDGVPGRTGTYGVLQQLLIDGRAVGVHFALSADRPASIPTSIASSVPRRIVLRQVDEDAYRMLNVPRDILSAESPPGRAVEAATGLELQIAVLGGTPSLATQARRIESLTKRLQERQAPRAAAIERLPEIILLSSLPSTVGGLPLLGVGDESLQPLGFEPSGTFMISGPPQSGRSTALRTMATAIHLWRQDCRLIYFGSRRSPLTELEIWKEMVNRPDDGASLARSILADLGVQPEPGEAPIALVIESLTDFVGSSAEQALAEAIKVAKRNGHFVLAESENTGWGSSWPLISEVRNGRRGIALQTDHLDGENLYRTPFARVQRSELPVGRGTFVQSGRTLRVQMPTPS